MVNNPGFVVPQWLDQWCRESGSHFASDEQAMAAAIELSAASFREGTGGPFGAVVVNDADGSLVAAGSNCVTSMGLSIAHAEVVALSRAQSRLGNWDLSGLGQFSLFTSCEPCVMCYGAVIWSGVRRLVCASVKDDAEAVGFDEGPRPENWAAALQDRGIEVLTGVLRNEARAVLQEYGASGGHIYNPGNQ
jgi:tRNA(Arg) A34 adenosine deaminase TadA